MSIPFGRSLERTPSGLVAQEVKPVESALGWGITRLATKPATAYAKAVRRPVKPSAGASILAAAHPRHASPRPRLSGFSGQFESTPDY